MIDTEEMDNCVDWIFNNLIKYNDKLIDDQQAALEDIENVIKFYAVGNF